MQNMSSFLDEIGEWFIVRVGIDAGGSLIKIPYEEKKKIHVRKYAIDESPAKYQRHRR